MTTTLMIEDYNVIIDRMHNVTMVSVYDTRFVYDNDQTMCYQIIVWVNSIVQMSNVGDWVSC